MKKIINYMKTHEPPWWLPLCLSTISIIISIYVIWIK